MKDDHEGVITAYLPGPLKVFQSQATDRTGDSCIDLIFFFFLLVTLRHMEFPGQCWAGDRTSQSCYATAGTPVLT